MSTNEEREASSVVLLSLCDQIEAMCQRAEVEISAFVVFSQAGPVEVRSPHPTELVIQHLRTLADELEEGAP